MGSLKDPKTWIPSINPKDCSQKICTISCTQWCKYIILPSPPPPPFNDDLGGSNLSPVVIVIITLIGSLSLLIGCYFMVSRYCSRRYESSMLLRQRVDSLEARDSELGVDGIGSDQAEDHSNYVPWIVLGKGLDEAVIKSIAICKYKKGDGFVTCTDCSVCLGEFQEDDSVKVLPKCSHAFHVYCIDTWLKTHLNCPLCRANVCCDIKSSSQHISPPPPPPPQVPVVAPELGERDVAFEMQEEGQMKMRTSKSMDNLCQTRVSTTQGLSFSRTHEITQEVGIQGDAGSSGNVLEGTTRV